MAIINRIKKIEEYFKEMQIVTIDGKQVIYVIVAFPYGWVIDEEIEEKYKVTISKSQVNGEFYFCTEIENGEDAIFNAIEYNIEKMKEAIERAQLLSEKTKELKHLFENEDITLSQLRNLRIIYDTKETEIIIPKKNEENEKTEVSKKYEEIIEKDKNKTKDKNSNK